MQTPTSSLESLKLSGDNNLPKAANFLTQLETMMSAVKKEAGALEHMKGKLKDMEDIKAKYFEARSKLADLEVENSDLRRKCKDAEQTSSEIRSDMQRLNDIYNSDRMKHMNLQQAHSKLEQDLNGLILEKDFLTKEAQKLSDLKTNLKAVKGQIHQLKMAADDERGKLQARVGELEKKLNQNGEHVWRLTDEIASLKAELEASREENRRIVARLSETSQSRKGEVLIADRQGMVIEDLTAQRALSLQHIAALRKDLSVMQAELSNAQHKVFDREEKLRAAADRMAAAEAAHSEQLANVTLTTGNLQDTIRDLSNKNHSLVQDNAGLKQRLGSKAYDEEKYIAEVAKLKQGLADQESALSSKDFEIMQAVQNARSVSLQRDDLSFKLQSVTAQLDSAQSQAKADQAKYWEEVRALKENEQLLLEETDKLSAELQEKMLQVHTLETQKLTNENAMQHEVSGASSMVNTLRAELEKRLAELVQLREERDQNLHGKEALQKTLEDLKNDMQRADHTFKRTLEADRNKMKQELQTRSNRIKQLETEKQELLGETQELMSQVAESQKQSVTHKASAEEAARHHTQLAEQFNVNKSRIVELQNEIKRLSTLENDLRADQLASEQRYQSDISKLDMMVKEARKLSSQQVLDLTNQVKSLFEEMDDYKRQADENADKERRMSFERDKLRTDYDHLLSKYNSSQDEVSKEVTALKRDLAELRGKAKLSAEHKTKLEMDVLTMSKELNRAEADLAKLHDSGKVSDANLQSAQDQIRSMRSTIETLQESKNQLAHRLQELENVIASKNQAIDSLNTDIVQVERDGLVEIRRLRLSMNASEQELNELRPAQALLQKELDDTKVMLTKALSNNNSTVSNILEDLKTAEDALTRERKNRQSDADEWRGKVKEVEFSAEKYRQELEELQTRAKSSHQDRELKVLYLEKEMDRIKAVIREKDERIEELEQQHHINRKRALEMKEAVDASQSEVAQLKSMLDMEQGHRKRLETRMRQLVSSAEMKSDFSTNSLATRARSAARQRDRADRADDLDHNTVISGQSFYGDDALGAYSRPSAFRDGPSVDNTVNYFDQGNAVPYSGGYIAAHSTDSDDYVRSPAKPTAQPAAAPSPAVDRVSAALSMKLAQQQRNSQQQISVQRPSSRPSTASGHAGYDPYYDAVDDEPLVGKLASSSMPVLPIAEPNDNSSAVEESIRRTQMVLNRRLGNADASAVHGNGNGNGLSNVELSPGNASGGRSGSAGSANGRSTSKLMDTIQQAHNMYPASPGPASKHSRGDDIEVSTPMLQPISPPAGKFAQQMAREDNAQDMEEDEEDDDEDLLDPAAVVAAADTVLGKDSLRFSLPSSKNSSGGGGIASAKGKKGTKKKAKKHPSEPSDTYLPRIGQQTKQK